MGQIFEDDFDGTASGEGSWINIGGGGSIVTGGDPSNCVRFEGGNGYTRQTGNKANITVFTSFKISDGFTTNAAFIDLRNSVVGNYTGISLCKLYLEPDHSFSIYTGDSTLIKNSKNPGNGDFNLENNTWYFVQFNCEISLAVVAFVNVVHLKVALAVNGKQLWVNEEKDTGIATSSLPNGAVACNLFAFTGAGNGPCFFDNIFVEDEVALNTYPYPGSPIFSRLTQGVIEPLLLPVDQSVRLSQATIELLELPTIGNVRLSQAVIEILLAGEFVISTSWRIYEA